MEEKKSGSLFSRFWGKKKSKKEEDESGKAFISRSSYKYTTEC